MVDLKGLSQPLWFPDSMILWLSHFSCFREDCVCAAGDRTFASLQVGWVCTKSCSTGLCCCYLHVGGRPWELIFALSGRVKGVNPAEKCRRGVGSSGTAKVGHPVQCLHRYCELQASSALPLQIAALLANCVHHELFLRYSATSWNWHFY